MLWQWGTGNLNDMLKIEVKDNWPVGSIETIRGPSMCETESRVKPE